MTTFADKLLAASEDESLSPADLRAWLRRAAIRIQNGPSDLLSVVLDKEIRELVEQIAASSEISPTTTTNALLRDWLISHEMMPQTSARIPRRRGALRRDPFGHPS